MYRAAGAGDALTLDKLDFVRGKAINGLAQGFDGATSLVLALLPWAVV
jgi:hypothetical protein